MRTALLWLVGVACVVAIIALVAWLITPSRATPAQTSNPSLPVAGSRTPQSASTTTESPLSVVTNSGQSVTTSNFLLDPATVSDPTNQGYYYLGYHMSMGSLDTTATATPPYIIEYIAPTNYFNIALLEEPLGETRRAAEQYLLAHLNITQDEACELKYMVSVPYSVNNFYSGENLGFSFCPGAVPLP